MNDLTISLIIPAYNEERYLSACLRAIANQTVRPFEVIVVDNNSTDSTSDIASKYPFVTVVSEQHQGIAYARNRGFNSAQGDIIARIDADSLLPNDWVANVQLAFRDNSVSAVTGGPKFNDVPFGAIFDYLQVLIYQKLQRLITGTHHLWGANMAIRRSAWQMIKIDCTARDDIDEDIDLTLCLRVKNLNIKFLPKLVVSASLRRGQYQPLKVISYLSTWPKDYWLHKRYFGWAVICVMTLIISIVTLPLTAGYWLLTTLRR